MYEVNEDAIGINSLCMWVGGCVCFWVICTELSSGVLMVRLRDWERVMMRERERVLAKAQYPEKTSESVCWGKVSESQPLEIFSPHCLVSTAILR